MMLRDARLRPPPGIFFVLLFTIVASFFIVGLAAEGTDSGRNLAGESPFTAKASLIRHWRRQVSGDLPISFFLNKASPLDAVRLATFSKLADKRSLSAQLSTFCKEANLFCFPDAAAGTSLKRQSKDANFADYKFQNFTSYGNDRSGGVDSFKNYTFNESIAVDSFRGYSSGSVDHDDKFTIYALDAVIGNETFNTYGTKSTDGTGDFSKYDENNNLPILTFTTYSDSTKGRTQDFKTYSQGSVGGDETFTSYGKNGDKPKNAFSNYGNESTANGEHFNNYGETANGASDSFTTYGVKETFASNNFTSYARGGNGATEKFTAYGTDSNIPVNTFRSYGSGGEGVTQTFSNYRDNTTTGYNNFKSYADSSKTGSLGFTSYGPSFDPDTFTTYAKDSNGTTVNFKTYQHGVTFKDYAKTGVNFATYINETGIPLTAAVKSRWVEPGKFFREKMLKTGTVMPMPNINDKMPKRSFLPRTILSKLPFSSSKIQELKEIFQASDDSSMTRILGNALSECERAPSAGETKRCAGSGEDVIDFATSVLGRNVAVRTTENTRGSAGDIMIGSVTRINGGRVTKSVSCHQSLYPYLLYYCHSVPKVRVYEADILDPKSKSMINHGVAICHVDTSSWSENHGAFIALGSGPGQIEVCHWIFENDMTWTISD